jgi:cell division protein YceG involved in septum cleavage
MNNYKIFLLFTIGVAMSLIWSSSSSLSSYLMPDRPLQIQIAMAQNDNTTASTTTTQNNSSINLGDPIFTEHDKATPPKKEFIKGMYRLQSSYSGSGVVKGVNFSVNGTILIVPRIDGGADVSGRAAISTAEGEKGTYNFYSIGHTDDNGTTRDNGAAFFHTTSAGKLSVVNNLVVVFKDQVDKAGNGMTIGWEWK